MIEDSQGLFNAKVWPPEASIKNKIKILWHIHGYPPKHNAGAEWMAHEINLKLLRYDCFEVKVINISNGNQDDEFQGVKVYSPADNNRAIQMWKEADIVFTHLDASPEAFNNAKLLDKQIVEFVHNSIPYLQVRSRPEKTYLVYNSLSTLNDLSKWYTQPYTILTPTVDSDRFIGVNGNRNGFITLVNHFEPKGGKVIHEIAKLMPKEKFLCVHGGYGNQYMESVKNMTYWPNQPDIREVFKETKIILMPSDYESFGRVAHEAMACGIPVVVSKVDGLLESVGDGGLFADYKKPEEWVKAIKETEKNYVARQKAAKEHSEKIKVKQSGEFTNFVEMLNKIYKAK